MTSSSNARDFALVTGGSNRTIAQHRRFAAMSQSGPPPHCGEGTGVEEPGLGRPLQRACQSGIARWLAALILFVTVLFSLALPATAQEVIHRFDSDVTLRADGTVEVTETIELSSFGIDIRRGIYRDIPTALVNPDGSRLRSDLDVLAVTRDGSPETFALESLGTDIRRIRIGDAEVFLADGRHTYVIRYTMSRMGRFFPDHDELYWNATGNYWDFPIEQASATITLPPGAVISDLAAYTGRPGSTEQASAIARTSDATARFNTIRQLQPGEGLTIAAGFQKGVLIRPSGAAAGANWVSDHRDLILPMLAITLVLAYYLLAWNAVGRDPAKGTVIPLFYPPKGFSPALVHFVHRMGWRNNGWTAFTAAIFSLAAKGLATIDNTGKDLRISLTDKPAEDLPPGEAVIHKFLSSRGTLEVNTSTGAAINTKRGDFTKAIESENRTVYFNNNGLYVFGGVALSALLMLALVVFDVIQPVFLVFAFILGMIVGLLVAVIPKLWAGNILSRVILLVWVVIFGGNMLGLVTDFSTGLDIDTGLLSAASIVLVNVVFAVLMRAPTVQGRKLMDEIDGFRMYLETAEKNRLNFEKTAPKMTVSRFESLLPYAIALGVEKPWSEHFESELSRHAVEDAAPGYHPAWYAGRDWGSGGFSKTVAAATSGMAAAMISAQPASSSSSGFSGGSSGGGGGGGGGGGW